MNIETIESKIMATPGPWRYHLKVLCDGIDDNGEKINPHTHTDYYAIEAGEGFWGGADHPRGFDIQTYMTEPDARLIAAAPDLLDAIGEMLLSLNKSSSNWNMDGDIERAYQLCKAAFKKAKS